MESCDAKKGFSPQGGSECDELASVTSSTCGSSINKPYTLKPDENGGIKHRTNKNRTSKSFNKVRTFRKRTKSRNVRQTPLTIPYEDSSFDSSESSPHYLKATTCSQGKKTGSLVLGNKSLQTLSSSSSFRNVGFLMKKASFKPRKGLLNYSKFFSEDVAVNRATYSSTIKGSNFSERVEARLVGKELEKVCRYHHCSLHGHCGGTRAPIARTKSFLYQRRKSMKMQKPVLKRIEPGHYMNKKNTHKSQVIPVVDSYEENRNNPGKEPFGYENVMGLDIVEAACGEMSFPERSYEENLEIYRKYSSLEGEFGGKFCSSCSCHIQDELTYSSFENSKVDVCGNGSSNVVEKSNEKVSNFTEDSSAVDCASEESNKFCPETPVAFEKSSKRSIIEISSFSSHSQASSDVNSEDERELKAEHSPAGNLKCNNNKITGVNEPEQEGRELQFSKQRHISMWHLIHQHMTENSAVGPTDKPVERENSVDGEDFSLGKGSTATPSGDSINDSENQEIELRKMFAIKLVREAIEKILLPEVQDQTSDDQSVTSESTPRMGNIERDQTPAITEQNHEESNAFDKKADREEGRLINDKSSFGQVIKKSEKKAPKHWSNLKKWILLQKFIRELEKVRKFNPKKPKILPLISGPEAEKVNLRHQTAGDKKNAEEWMLDYALRQAVRQLEPTQKKKVSLLVKAFETVAPPSLKSDEPVSGKNRDKDDEGILIQNSANQESESKIIDIRENREAFALQTDKKEKHIEMWHMIYQHVVSGIAEKMGTRLLDESEEDIVISTEDQESREFTKSDALKLVKEAVDKILLPEIQDASFEKTEQLPRGKNWSKLKRVIMLKRSIEALKKARNVKPKQNNSLPEAPPGDEGEKVELRREMMDERKKAEQWMLDYAVRHIVTKLTPDRKRRVSMLVEAFEAVVPLPEM
ncbi:calmodulin binding [Striga hermonthica]|uniref:Calmodulin binding n=1 Tax=Striga hermonthica TaxID=68872 RepID=A0A9N7MPG4_STRHE|nr:calmodulin binding [Striga hermonthica]